jgi:hypothetical protein
MPAKKDILIFAFLMMFFQSRVWAQTPHQEGQEGYPADSSAVSATEGSPSQPVSDETMFTPRPPPFMNDLGVVLKTGFEEAMDVGLILNAGLGPLVWRSSSINDDYSDYGASFGMGYEFTRTFSLSLGFTGTEFDSGNNSGTGAYRVTVFGLALSGKYRFLTSDLRPYLVLNAGLGLNDAVTNLSSNNADEEDDLFLGVGAGAEYQLTRYLFLYAQGCYFYDFVSSGYSHRYALAAPIACVPLEFGIALER